VPVGVAGRTSPNAPCHKCHRLFFSPPHKRDESRVRVTEQTLHSLQGAKTGEPICIRQAAGFACFRHPSIMPKSRPPATNILCRENRALSTAESRFLPTRNHEEPYKASACAAARFSPLMCATADGRSAARNRRVEPVAKRRASATGWASLRTKITSVERSMWIGCGCGAPRIRGIGARTVVAAASRYKTP
jgi:hypothetical protein